MSDEPIDFKSIPPSSVINIPDILINYENDSYKNKVDLLLGSYRTDEGKPWVLPVVKELELTFAQDPTCDYEYLPTAGQHAFTIAAAKLCLGSESPVFLENRYCSIQTPGCSASLAVGFKLISEYISKVLYLPNPTFNLHMKIAESCKFTEIKSYRYWHTENLAIDFDGMLEDLKAAPAYSIILLQGIGHNPTGSDPTQLQWQSIANVMKNNNLLPIFDIAYLGIISGDCDLDAWAVRYFIEQGFNLLIGMSFSKNFGFYGERVGALIVACSTSKAANCVLSQLSIYCEAMWGTPPNHGARIVSTILNNPTLLIKWKGNLRTISDRILKVRKELYDKLKALGTPGSWEHVINQVGMFCYTGLTEKQTGILTSKYHIYLLKSGRINVCGLNHKNLDHVAKAIHDVVINK